ncbi:MAG: ABC transporter substrate-binding protein [Anaerolineaceae bacterium]|nr:ABC transporter substrate-binding protein [Anaerolineaceae bacterium]
MKSKNDFYLIVMMIAAILLLIACGGGAATDDAAPADDQDTGTESTTEESGSEGPGAVEESDEPTEIRISYLQQFTDLNPFNVNNPAATGVAIGLFDTLVRATDDGEIIPWLAESWEISDDQLTITFDLRDDVTFSDGTPLNADAVVYSADLYQDPDLFLGTSVLTMTGWEALDEYTVQFTFDQPDATALYVLTQPNTSIVSPTAYEEMGTDAFGINPVGSGPYILDHWEPGVEVVMTKNPNYWQEGVGLADRIVWRNFQDGAAALLAAQSGELDLLHEQEPKDVPLFEAIPGFQVGGDQTGWYALVLNTRIPPFDKIENRMAFAYALDYDVLLNVAFEGYGAIPDGLIPPGSWAYQSAVDPVHKDLDLAREMLAAAGNPDGFDFKVSVTPQPFRSQILQIMQSSLAEVGINLEIEVNEFARHIEILRDDHNGANAGFVVQQNLHVDPATYLRLYAGCNALVGMTGWCDPDDMTFDDLLAQSVATFDTDERIAILHEANVMEMEAFVVVPYVFQETLYAWNSDKLGDYNTTFVGGYNYLYLQPNSN